MLSGRHNTAPGWAEITLKTRTGIQPAIQGHLPSEVGPTRTSLRRNVPSRTFRLLEGEGLASRFRHWGD